jgi:hypothetical protein
LNTWLKNLISVGRKKFKEIEHLSTLPHGNQILLSKFSKPSHIIGLHVIDLDLVIVFILQSEGQKNDVITFYEVKDITQALSKIEEDVLSKLREKKKIALSIVHDINELFRNISSRARARQVSWRSIEIGIILKFSSKCLSLNPENVLEEWLKTRELVEERRELVTTGKATLFGYLWMPPITISDSIASFSTTYVIDRVYKGIRMLVDDLGYFWLVISDKPWDYPKDKQNQAIGILNEIMAVANLHGFKATSVTLDSLNYGLFDQKTEDIVSQMWAFTTGRGGLISRILSHSKLEFHSNPRKIQEISKSDLESIIMNSEKMTINTIMRSYLMVFLDSCTHYYNEEYVPSFLLGWMLIEKYVDEVWESFLTDSSISKKRREKLTGPFWTADDKIESLNLMEKIKTERYKKIMKFKQTRNKILHEGLTPNQFPSLVKDQLDLIREIINEISSN